MGKIKILIVEDNIIIADDLSNILQDLDYEVTDIAMNYHEAIESINTKMPDLCLLDIVIRGEKDGINVAETINQKYGLPFLFVTSHSDKDTVERAKSTRPKGYIIKPFDKDDVYASIEMALAQSNAPIIQKPSMLIRQGGMLHRIYVHSIQFIKIDGNYLEINTIDNRKFLHRQTLKEFLELDIMSAFCQVHKSFAVNLAQVDAVKSASVIGQVFELPIGKTFRNTLKDRLNSVR